MIAVGDKVIKCFGVKHYGDHGTVIEIGDINSHDQIWVRVDFGGGHKVWVLDDDVRAEPKEYYSIWPIKIPDRIAVVFDGEGVVIYPLAGSDRQQVVEFSDALERMRQSHLRALKK